MLHQTFLFLGQLWQLFEVSQILDFLRVYFGKKASSDLCNKILYLKIFWTIGISLSITLDNLN